MRSFGPGNVPSKFYPLIKEKTSKGYPIFVSSQCAGSGISPGGSKYAVGKGVIRAGGIPIGDMSPTATAVKLMSVMAQSKDLNYIRREMVGKVYAGELTLRAA